VSDDRNEFLNEAGRDESPGLIAEFRQFLGENAKWWLTPILVVLLLVGVLLVLAASGVAPFLYALW